MRERPIIFSGESVRAILDGRKVQTRRVIKPVQPRDDGRWPAGRDPVPDCPFGRVGDRLWVRETWADHPDGDGPIYRATDPTWDDEPGSIRWRPPIHMPRWASRLTLEVAGVRVERLQAIDKAGARAEGCHGIDGDGHRGYVPPLDQFEAAWDALNGKRAPWSSNPWVWVVTFRCVEERPHAR